MAPRDFYEVLGLTQDASAAQIKKAYRSLAMKYHPDRNPGNAEAEGMFKEATKAYEVLSDDAKRQAYDRYGHAGVQGGAGPGFGMEFDLHDALRAFMRDFGDVFGVAGGGRGGSRDRGRGSDLRVALGISLREVLTGAKKKIKVRRGVSCGECEGSGGARGEEPETCGMCKGSGQVRRVQSSFFGQFINVGACPQCNGRGRWVREICSGCGGEGRVRGEATVELEIPPGVGTGDYLNLRGEGDAGIQGGPAGDLEVHLEVEEAHGFQRNGRDLITELEIGPARAVLGGKLTVPTLEGTATLDVPAGVQHGTLLRLKGKGLPPLRGGPRGSQFVRVNVTVPERVDKRTRKLYRELLDIEDGGA